MSTSRQGQNRDGRDDRVDDPSCAIREEVRQSAFSSDSWSRDRLVANSKGVHWNGMQMKVHG